MPLGSSRARYWASTRYGQTSSTRHWVVMAPVTDLVGSPAGTGESSSCDSRWKLPFWPGWLNSTTSPTEAALFISRARMPWPSSLQSSPVAALQAAATARPAWDSP